MDNASNYSTLRNHSPAATPAPARVTWQIGILLQDHFPLLDVSNVAEVFDLANRLHAPGAQPYLVKWLSARGGTVPSRSGIRAWTECVEVHHAGHFDILFIVGDASRALADGDATDWQRLLARPDARHSANRDKLALFSVPAMPGADATAQALSLVRRTSSAGLAAHVAQQLAIAHPVHHPEAWADVRPMGIGDAIQTVARRMRESCEQRLSMPDVANMASMSERTFLRRFKLEMGMRPSEYLMRARLDLACSLLVESDLPVDKIARRAGLGCGDRLAKLFRQHLAMSPTEYRGTARRRATGVRPFTATEGPA